MPAPQSWEGAEQGKQSMQRKDLLDGTTVVLGTGRKEHPWEWEGSGKSQDGEKLQMRRTQNLGSIEHDRRADCV